jgi:outer membrane protein TolC
VPVGNTPGYVPEARHWLETPVVNAVIPSTATDPDSVLAWYRQYAVGSTAVPVGSTSRYGPQPGNIPSSFRPWWLVGTLAPMRPSTQAFSCGVDTLILRALQNSPQIRAIQAIGPIQQTEIVTADAEFDWIAFLESRYDDNSDPVGDLLTTGAAIGRFRDHVIANSAGVRRRLRSGADVSLSQDIGYRDNNSTFLTPSPQGTARLTLSFTQPLLRGSGEGYNAARTVLATINAQITGHELQQRLQAYLTEVHNAYWSLFQARAVHLQRRRAYESVASLVRVLESRRDLDARGSQLVRAQSETSARLSELYRSEAAIQDVESQLKTLIGTAGLPPAGLFELVPRDLPPQQLREIPLAYSLQAALQNRPDILQAYRRVRLAGIRSGVAEKDLLPRLDLVLSTYVAGLDGDSVSYRAWENQFNQGEPGFSVGLVFEVPLGGRLAKARHNREVFELRRAMHEFQSTIESALSEVEIASRSVQTNYREMLARYQALQSSEAEAQYLMRRWKLVPSSGELAGAQLLELLLEAQSRRAATESAFVDAQVRYTIALTAIKLVTGEAFSSNIASE